MNKFKLGDKVEILKNNRYNGMVGEVVIIDPNDFSYGVEIYNTNSRDISTDKLTTFSEYENISYLPNRIRHMWCWDGDIEHCRIANTAIARKLYPNAEENGEWLILK